MIGGIIGALFCLGISVFALVAIILAFVKRTTIWIVLACSTVFFALAGMVTTGVFVFREAQKKAKLTSTVKRITSDDGWVSLEVPGNWDKIPNLNSGATVQFGNTLAEEYLTIFSDPRSDFRGTLQEFARLTTQRMHDNLENASLGTPERLTINGFPAQKVRLEGTTSGVQITYLHTSVETPDGFHQIVQWTLPSKESQALPIFEKVAASFQLARSRASAPAVEPTPPLPRGGEQL